MASEKIRKRARRKADELIGHPVTLVTGERVTIVKVAGDLAVIVDSKKVSRTVGCLSIKEAAGA